MTTAVTDYARSDTPAVAAPLPTEDERERMQLEDTWRGKPGLWGFLTSTNHKDIGLRFIITAFVFFLLAGLQAFMMRLQLRGPPLKIPAPDAHNQPLPT